MARKLAALVRTDAVRLAAAFAIGALGIAHLRYHAGYTLDDAYISFRYARNLVRGTGLVYNPGDYVKGYSNTLFTLCMSLPEWLGRDPIGFARLLGIASFVGLCIIAYRCHVVSSASPARKDRSHWLLAFFATSTAIAVHFSGGLETGMYATLVFAAVLRRVDEQASEGRPWSALLFCFVIWSRPEGSLIFAASALHDVIWRGSNRRFHPRDLAFYLAPPLAYAGELAASLAYYGAAFPQTYYAKTRPTAGLLDAITTMWASFRAQLAPDAYLSRSLREVGLGWLGLCLTPLALLDPTSRRRNAALCLALLAQLVFVVRAGDDWAPAFRFGVPLLPLWFALIIDAFAAVARFAPRFERLVFNALAVIAVGLCLPIQVHESQRIAIERPVNAENKLAQGRFFTTLAEPGITLSSFDIGGQGYAAGGFAILDTVGLTVRETTGCRDRMLPRCVRYAQLALPELIRLHNNRKRDMFVSRGAPAERAYLPLDGGKYLIATELILPPRLPNELTPQTAQPAGAASLINFDLPPAVRPGRTIQIALYWEHARLARAALADRKLRWRGASGDHSAQSSESILRQLKDSSFGDEPLLRDLVTLDTPAEPGRYELQVVVGDRALSLGFVDCQDEASARETARQWIASPVEAANDPVARLRRYERAAELSEAAASEYQQAAVALAARFRREAEAHLASAPVPALRIAQRGARELLRAYWKTGYASRALRQEIDANGALRQRVIAAELAPLVAP